MLTRNLRFATLASVQKQERHAIGRYFIPEPSWSGAVLPAQAEPEVLRLRRYFALARFAKPVLSLPKGSARTDSGGRQKAMSLLGEWLVVPAELGLPPLIEGGAVKTRHSGGTGKLLPRLGQSFSNQ